VCVRDCHDLGGSDGARHEVHITFSGFIRRCGDDGNGPRQNAIVGRKDGGEQARARAVLRIGGVSGSTVVRSEFVIEVAKRLKERSRAWLHLV